MKSKRELVASFSMDTGIESDQCSYFIIKLRTIMDQGKNMDTNSLTVSPD